LEISTAFRFQTNRRHGIMPTDGRTDVRSATLHLPEGSVYFGR